MDNKTAKRKLQSLSNYSDEEIDLRINSAHDKAFAKINCLECANCCKTKGPALNKKDVNRIAKHLKLEPQAFVDEYLEYNVDDNLVLKVLPCPFLGKDNYCDIYEIRPLACASYPHTDTRKTKNLFPYLLEHMETCPAIEVIIENA